MNVITELQRQITNYSRTLEVYRGYSNSKWSKKYYASHESDIIIHNAAKLGTSLMLYCITKTAVKRRT